MSDEVESRINRITTFLELRLAQMHSYHDHKETMAHAAAIVLLGYVAAVISLQTWPPEWVPALLISRDIVSLVGAMGVWLLIHVYMRWQLRNRRVAALYVACLLKVLREWAITPPADKDLKPYCRPKSKKSRFHIWIDYLIPYPLSQVSTDEGLKGYPEAMVREYLDTKSGAVLAENLVSYGSILLGLFLFIRVWP